MKHLLISLLVFSALLFSTTNISAQDALFAGPTFRMENTTIGLNLGVKKDFKNFGAIAQINLYPYRLEINNSSSEVYFTYTDYSIAGLYNFQLENEITIFPIVGLALNTVRSKAKVKSILEPEVEREFTKGKRQNSTGATFGVGAMKTLGKLNLIADFRYDATEYSSLKLFVGLAYKFGNKGPGN